MPKTTQGQGEKMEADLRMLEGCAGLFVGQLDDGELSAFNRLCEARLMHRHYDGVGGILGLARVAKGA
jgi:hypothetical protein